jgi:hypothetical protein
MTSPKSAAGSSLHPKNPNTVAIAATTMTRGSVMKAGPIAMNASPITRIIGATAMSAVKSAAIAGAIIMITHIDMDGMMMHVKLSAAKHGAMKDGAKRHGVTLCTTSGV